MPTRMAPVAAPDDTGRPPLAEAAENMRLSARGYRRALQVARILANLVGGAGGKCLNVAESLFYRQLPPGV